ncbi:hypothetical protein OROGR_003921 [Orobanche gracilis]
MERKIIINKLSEPSFDPRTCGLWAHHASAAPLRFVINYYRLSLPERVLFSCSLPVNRFWLTNLIASAAGLDGTLSEPDTNARESEACKTPSPLGNHSRLWLIRLLVPGLMKEQLATLRTQLEDFDRKHKGLLIACKGPCLNQYNLLAEQISCGMVQRAVLVQANQTSALVQNGPNHCTSSVANRGE